MFQLTRYPASIYAVCQASARFSVAHRRLPPPGPVPGGAHQLVQHCAHLGLRRHGGGGASGRAGVGRCLGPLGLGVWGERGKGVRGRCDVVSLAAAGAAASRRAGKGAGGRLRESPGCCSSRRRERVEDGSPVSFPPRCALALRPLRGGHGGDAA